MAVADETVADESGTLLEVLAGSIHNYTRENICEPTEKPPPMSSSRRDLLAAVAAGSAALAGCTTLDRVRKRVADERRDPPERRVAPDWSPAPGTWAGWGYGPGNTNHNPHAEPPRSDPAADWAHDIGGEVDSLVVAEGRVFASTGGAVVALDAEDGSLCWRRETDGHRRLRYVDGRLYEYGDHRLWARTLEDESLWTVSLDETRHIYDILERSGYVFVGTIEGYLTVHADTGAVVRERDARFERLATDGERIFTRNKGRTRGYERTGRTLDRVWSTSSRRGYAGPTVAGGRVYVSLRSVGDETEDVQMYDTDGTDLGTEEFEETPTGVAPDDGRWFVGTSTVSARNLGESGRLVSISADGDRRWSFEPDGGVTTPVVADDTVYAGPRSNADVPLVAFDADSGEELWRREASGTPRMATVDETLYVATDSIVALR